MSKVNKDVIELSEKIKAGLSVNVADGVATTTVDDGLFMANLPETVTKELVETYEGYRSTFMPAATRAFGQVALETAEKHKKIDQVSAEFKMHGKDTFGVNFSRSESYRNPADATAEPITKWK